MDTIPVLAAVPGSSVNVSATATSANAAIVCTGCDKIHVVNTSATLYVTVRAGTGAQTAVLATDIAIPPMGQIVIPCNSLTDNVAAIASGAGPTVVVFTPLLRGA
jgi:hypothetical protein